MRTIFISGHGGLTCILLRLWSYSNNYKLRNLKGKATTLGFQTPLNHMAYSFLPLQLAKQSLAFLTTSASPFLWQMQFLPLWFGPVISLRTYFCFIQLLNAEIVYHLCILQSDRHDTQSEHLHPVPGSGSSKQMYMVVMASFSACLAVQSLCSRCSTWKLRQDLYTKISPHRAKWDLLSSRCSVRTLQRRRARAVCLKLRMTKLWALVRTYS